MDTSGCVPNPIEKPTNTKRVAHAGARKNTANNRKGIFGAHDEKDAHDEQAE